MKFGAGIVKCRWVILVIGIILLIPSAIGYFHTRVNYDMLTYLPDDMETVQGQDLLMEDFGKGGFSLIVVEDMKQKDISRMADEIKEVPHVDTVLNLQQVMDPSVPLEMYPDIISDNFSNEDATMLVVFYDTSTSAEETLDAVTEIRKIGTKTTYISGMSAMVLDLRNISQEEELKYVAVAVVLSVIAMMILLDSFLIPVIFIVSIGMAIIYNLGSNVMMGEISYITKAIAAVLQLGVTMDYSIFLWHSFVEKLDEGLEEKEAMAKAVDATLISVTGSSITTVAGFLALCFMSYTMGMDLGIVMAKGVVIGVICSITVLPSLILLFNKALQKTRHRSVLPDMLPLSKRLTKRWGIFVLIFAVLVAPAVIGYQKDNISYDFSNLSADADPNDEKDAALLEKLSFIEAGDKLQEDFGIATSYIIIADADLPAKDGRAMSEELEDLDGVMSVLGTDAFVGSAIPKEILPDELNDSLVAGGHQMILVNSSYKVSSDESNEQIDAVNEIVHTYDPTASVIGEGPATKDLIQLTSKDFAIVSWISIGMVFVIILVVLQSISLPVILVALIEFAIYVNLGISGYTGQELLFIVPVCISTIQLGSTVDYAILTSTRYKQERKNGREKRDAIITASRTSIPSIIVSAMGFFAATFGVAVYSNISIISTFCMLMARGAIISMLTIIFILPAMLMAFDGIICRTTRGLRPVIRQEAEKESGMPG